MPPPRPGPSSPRDAIEQAKRQRLSRMKLAATGLLVAAAVLYAVATALRPLHPAWGYVAAFAEASMVGALADWFAVVALFRHPMGLRFIPHTAILPRNKDRIADNLGDFVHSEFFSTERIVAVIASIDPAGHLADWLSKEANAARVADVAGGAFSYALGALNEDEVRGYFRKTVFSGIRSIDLAGAGGSILDALTHDGRHQVLLDHALKGASDIINDPEVRERIVQLAAEHLPLYFDSLKQSAGKLTIAMIVRVVANTFADVNTNPEHPLRIAFDEKVRELVERLKHDDAFRLRIEQIKERLANDPALHTYLDSLWGDLRAWLQADLARDDSALKARIVSMAGGLGQSLRGDAAMRRWINEQIMQYVPALVTRYGPRLGAFIADKMKGWKDEEVVEKLELNIGPDLQFVRVNGTIVGGLVGLGIHALTVWLAVV